MHVPLKVDFHKAAVLAIDVHRGHLDPSVATMPVAAELAARIVAANQRFYKVMRGARVPIIYSILEGRPIPGLGRDGLANPFKRAVVEHNVELADRTRSDLRHHNLQGSVQTQIHPDLLPGPNDHEVRSKRRFGSFYNTDLEVLTRSMGTTTLFLTGINTNTCVQNAAFEGYNRDFQVVVVEDCVTSLYGEDLHRFALENIRRCMGWVRSTDEVLAMLAEWREGNAQTDRIKGEIAVDGIAQGSVADQR